MNIKTIQKHLILTAAFAVVAFLLMVVTPVSASIFDDSRGAACEGAGAAFNSADCGGPAAAKKIDTTLENIVNLLSLVIGIVAVIVIIVNGLRFITSGGDSNTVSSAKNGILYAIVGLIIVALAQVIVRFVLTKA